MKHLLKKLPFDINITTGGSVMLFLVLVQQVLVLCWPWLQPEFSWTGTFLMFIPVLVLALMLYLMRHDHYWWWAHFIGTDVKCRDAAHQKDILDWAWPNHRFWSEFTTRVATPPEGQYSVRFRSRDKALMAKLSVP